jgi:hypothetical protein
MATRRLILIPPSEGKAPGGDGPPWDAGEGAAHPLAPRRREVASALAGAVAEGGPAAARLLGVRGDTLERAVAADLAVPTAPTLPAIDRYTGVLYQHLDAATLPRAARRRLDSSVRILSGLWGVVAPDEAIADYRLKMSASLSGLGRLSTWWRPAVSAHLAATLASGRGRAEVWNLLPREHDAAWAPPDGVATVTATFLQRGRDGRLAAVSHWNKALKGSLVRHLVTSPGASVEDLLDWDHPDGYRLDPASVGPTGPGGLRTDLRFVARQG